MNFNMINDWLNLLGEFVEVYHVMLLLPKNCLVFWNRQPWVSLADVTLLVGVHKYRYLLNFWFKRVKDCYIRVSQIVKTKSGVLLTFVWNKQKEIYYVKAYLLSIYTLLNQKLRRYLWTSTSNVTSARETHDCLFQKTKQVFGRSSIAC